MKKNTCIWTLSFFSLVFVLLTPHSSLSKEKDTAVSALNVVVITVDTLRADRLGCYGYRHIKTPQMDTLAREGVLFEKAFTPVPTTLPAHTSLFTGTYPVTHGIRNNGTFALTDSAVTLAELFKEKGYHTAAFISSFVLDSRFGLNQGFTVYDDDLVTGVETQALLQKERRAETVTRAAIQWLNSVNNNTPFFLWVHYYDPHDKYDPPSPFAEAYAHCLYDGEIAYTDSWIGVLINKLKEMNIYEKTLFILVADHGEGLGDHQEDTHGIFLYDATLHVPLIFRYPGRLPQNIRIGSLVRLIDISPTILDLFGYKIPKEFQGESLLPLLEGRKKDLSLTLYCETEYPRFTYGWSPIEGMRTDTWKYIKAPKGELYNLSKDPGEERNILGEEQKQGEKLQKEFIRLQKQLSSPSPAPSSKSVSLDQATKERLKSLGYLFASDEEKNKSTYPDPKDMIGLLAHFKKGAEHLSQKKYEEAVSEFQQVLKKDPLNKDAFTCLGAVYQAMGKKDQALEAYQQAVSLGPDRLENLVALGSLYMDANQEEQGKATFEEAVRVNDECREAHLNLGLYYISKKNWAEAEMHMKKILASHPKDFLARNHLVSVYYQQGKADEAVALAQAILADNPKDPSALYNLGSIYMEQKKYPEALKAFQSLAEVRPDYSPSYQYMGMVYFYQRAFDQAIDAFQKAAANDPKWADPHLNLGILYAQYKGDFESALREFQKVLELDPQHAMGRQFLEQTQRTIDRLKSGQVK